MQNFNIYEDMAKRTGGDIYIGVVGPVRTGKSTFIQKFMNLLVIPNAERTERTIMTDEMPQSASGKTVMTTEPKFVPSQAVRIVAGEGVSAKIRLIDCVGYPVAGAEGFTEEGNPRLIRTPWNDDPIPFQQAAEIGTRKVIREHATIGVLVTTDGTITGIPRENYIPAEERCVRELTEIDKPFVMLLNSTNPSGVVCSALRAELEEKYKVPVLATDVENTTAEELTDMLRTVLFAFPLLSFDIRLPRWMQSLPPEHPLIAELLERVRAVAPDICRMRDIDRLSQAFAASESLTEPLSMQLSLGEGKAVVEIGAKEGVFQKTLGDICGEKLQDEYDLMNYVRMLAESRNTFERFRFAYEQAQATGYGIMQPAESEMQIAPPEATKQSGRYGMKIRATSPSYHIVKVDVQSEVNPVVGSEPRSADVVQEMIDKFSENPDSLLETNMFGRSVRSAVKEGLIAKSESMPQEARRKMRRTISRITNEGKGGVICILL